jgi:hypothetical protein
MSKIPLASGHITPADAIVVELVVIEDMPMVMIIWPKKPTPVSPKRYDEIASRMRILANGSTELAARKGRKRTVSEDEE